jgi:hypothetical protein
MLGLATDLGERYPHQQIPKGSGVVDREIPLGRPPKERAEDGLQDVIRFDPSPESPTDFAFREPP